MHRAGRVRRSLSPRERDGVRELALPRAILAAPPSNVRIEYASGRRGLSAARRARAWPRLVQGGN